MKKIHILCIINILWVTSLFAQVTFSKTIAAGLIGESYSIQQTGDSGFVLLVGVTDSSYNKSICLIKTNKYGNVLWFKSFVKSESVSVPSCQQTHDGGYVMATYHGLNRSLNLIKINSFGDVVWSKAYPGYSLRIFMSVQQTYDAGYFLCASMDSTNLGNYDAYLYCA